MEEIPGDDLRRILGDEGKYKPTIINKINSYFKDIKDAQIKKRGKTQNVQTADVLIILDGILETDLESRWFQKPTYYFIRAVYDKFHPRG